MITFKQFLDEAEKVKRTDKEKKLSKYLSQWNKDMRKFRKNSYREGSDDVFDMSGKEYKRYFTLWWKIINPNFTYPINKKMLIAKNSDTGEISRFYEMQPVSSFKGHEQEVEKVNKRAWLKR